MSHHHRSTEFSNNSSTSSLFNQNPNHHFSFPNQQRSQFNHANHYHQNQSNQHHQNTNVITNLYQTNNRSSSLQQQQQQPPQQQYRDPLNCTQPIILKSEHRSPLIDQQNQQSPIQNQYHQFITSNTPTPPSFHDNLFMSKYQQELQHHQHHQHQQIQDQSQNNQPQQQQQQYYSRISSTDSLSSEDLQSDQQQQHHQQITNLHHHHQQHQQQQLQQPMSVYYSPRVMGYPAMYQTMDPSNQTARPPTSPQWNRSVAPYPVYFTIPTTPNTTQTSTSTTSTSTASGTTAQDAYSYSHDAATQSASNELDRLPQLQLYTQSPSMAPMMSNYHNPYGNYDTSNLKVDLYHKPRGSKGTWVPIAFNDQIRVTEGKGKRLKMIIHSEQELTKVGLQVGLLDQQSVNNNTPTRRNSSSQSPPISGSSPSSPGQQSITSTTSTSFNINNAATAPSPMILNSSTNASSPLPLNSSINSSPSPSSFSLSSPSQSPIQSPSYNQSATATSQYSVAISVTPPSGSPQPTLPLAFSTALPAPDPQGLSVESVRVYRYPSQNMSPLSALEFELKLAKLSKRLSIFINAQSKDGHNFEGRSVDFFAHNNGKHNASNTRNIKKSAPYPSPTLPGIEQTVPTSPSDRSSKKKTSRTSSSPLKKQISSSNNSNSSSSSNNGGSSSGGNPPLPSIPIGSAVEFPTTWPHTYHPGHAMEAMHPQWPTETYQMYTLHHQTPYIDEKNSS